MSDHERKIQELETAVAELVAKDEIKELRHTYWYGIADKNVDKLLNCFTEDAELDYGFGVMLHGKSEIRPFFEKLLSDPDLRVQLPRGTNPIITFTGKDTADGRWLVDVASMSNGKAPARRTAVEYTETYRREAGGWKISWMKNHYKFFERPALEAEFK